MSLTREVIAIVSFLKLFSLGLCMVSTVEAAEPTEVQITVVRGIDPKGVPTLLMPAAVLKNNNDYYLCMSPSAEQRSNSKLEVLIARGIEDRLRYESIDDEFDHDSPYYANSHITLLKAKNTFKAGLLTGRFPQEIVFDVTDAVQVRKAYESVFIYKMLFNYETYTKVESIEVKAKRKPTDEDDIKFAEVSSAHYLDLEFVKGTRSLSSPVFDKSDPATRHFIGVVTLNYKFDLQGDVDQVDSPEFDSNIRFTVIDPSDLKMWIERRPE